ncbi:MAG: KamA family radical SAM protein [Deltaproteobacteria bacterium]|nr:MAG: KamA family radical SAM protein [Deltaproteobacteria bacterium]
MEDWQRNLSKSIIRLEQLAFCFPIDVGLLKAVSGRYPIRITPYYLGLIREIGDPIWRQCVPDIRELEEDHLSIDPLNEGGLSPVPGLIHRYPDRVVLLVSSECATFCRFCMRKNQFQQRTSNADISVDSCLKYIRKTPSIRDVVLSGGDPLMLQDEVLDEILSELRKVPHVEIIRINTRMPVTLPERITHQLCRMLRRHVPLYVNTHFNHPAEITETSSEACARLADAGVPLGNQTVLLRGVNDDPAVMRRLMQRLLTIRVRPYYIHQMDLVKGTGHFRTRVEKGLEIMAGLRGHTSGMANPYYVIDLPGGKGKVPLLPDGVKREEGNLLLRNYLGEMVEYPNEG